MTDGVDVSECEVETLENVSVDVIDGKLITVPLLEVEFAVAVVVTLALVRVVLFPEIVAETVSFPEAVDVMVPEKVEVMVWFPLVMVVVPLPDTEVIVALHLYVSEIPI